ncbi:hypothetical protein INR49_022757 [Caranx melampygus]|nr:hypothetical protein INR49_022757 [Caranx melampygus]
MVMLMMKVMVNVSLVAMARNKACQIGSNISSGRHDDVIGRFTVCLHYNKGSGPHGCCTFQNTCTKVHLCQHFVQGDCLFGPKCKRQHTIDVHGRRLLEERGLSSDIIHHLPLIYRNIHHLTTAATATVSAADECRRVHFYLPYKWEVLDGSTWVNMHHMEDIERDFCDPSKTQSSGDWPVNFLTMTQGSHCVRRLSTVSSITKPPHYTLTTRWRWYYKGDQGTWVEYGELDDKNRTTSVTSRTLEEAYLSARTPEVKVVKGQREYVVSFKGASQVTPKSRQVGGDRGVQVQVYIYIYVGGSKTQINTNL